jgi:hypothetical protein
LTSINNKIKTPPGHGGHPGAPEYAGDGARGALRLLAPPAGYRHHGRRGRLHLAHVHCQGPEGILPPRAKFIRGLIESPDLTPTAARDKVQRDEKLAQVREALGRVVLDHLKRLADTDPTKLGRLLEYHHYHIKGMALEDEGFFQAIADLVPFETNRGSRTLPEYLGQQPQGEARLLYFSERGAGTQSYLLCDAQGLEVICAHGPLQHAVMMSHHLQIPENARIMASTANEVLHRFVGQAQEITRARKELAQFRQQAQVQAEATARSPWVTCFVALPFQGYDDLLDALRRHFEGPPWFWEVLRADKRYESNGRIDIGGHLSQHLARSHVFLAEISDGNPNVMIEVGRMQALAPTPLLYLERREAPAEIADLDGKLKVHPQGDYTTLVRELEKFEPLRAVTASRRYLSPLLLEGQSDWQDFSRDERTAIHRHCPTIESVLEADTPPRDIGLDARAWKLLRRLVEQAVRPH